MDLNASFAQRQPAGRRHRLLSQSGALGTGMLDWAAANHVGFSLFAASGPWPTSTSPTSSTSSARTAHTRSILVYMESITDARKFMSAARHFAKNKPIIVLKSGRTARSARRPPATPAQSPATTSSTAPRSAASASCACDEVADLFDAAEVLDSRRLPARAARRHRHQRRRPRRYGHATRWSSTAASSPSSPTRPRRSSRRAARLLEPRQPDRRRSETPAATGSSTAAQAALADPSCDGMLVIYTPQAMSARTGTAWRDRGRAQSRAQAAHHRAHGRDRRREARDIFRDAARALLRHARGRGANVHEHVPVRAQPRTALRDAGGAPIDVRADQAQPAGQLCLAWPARAHRPHRGGVQALSTAYRSPRSRPGRRTSEEALEAAEQIGYPVVLKILSHDITHKSAVGGVEVGVCSASTSRRPTFARS